MSRGEEEVRRAALGGNRAFQVVDGGKAGGGGGGGGPSGPQGPGPSVGSDDDPCPVTPLGDIDGVYHFLDPIGQKRELNAHQLGSRHHLMSLFRGDDSWLRRHFPVKKEFDDGNGNKTTRTVDFRINDAARYLIYQASSHGLYGPRMVIRKPGIWRGDDGHPIVHCGNGVLINGKWERPGTQTGDQIWGAAESTARPDTACDQTVAVHIQEQLQQLWNYRNEASPIALLGTLYSGYLCAALDWRNNCFVVGGSGSGKSAMTKVVRAALPVQRYLSDTSKAGIEQQIEGIAVPAIIDEANDRQKSYGRDLADFVLSASGDGGTQLARGTSDGKGRSGTIVTSVIMFSINPPPLEPQHLNRFVIIELTAANEGEDYREQHQALATYVAKHARSLWGRAIASFSRYQDALRMFREALRARGCSPREMDGKGALLAGWFVLTHEGLPDARKVTEGVAALGDYIVTTTEAAVDDGPRRAVQHLLNSPITMDRSSARGSVGTLIERVLGEQPDELGVDRTALTALRTSGMRPIPACVRRDKDQPLPPDGICRCQSCWDPQWKKPVPREGREAGVWFAKSHVEIEKLFAGTPFDAGRWEYELKRLPSALLPRRTVRVSGANGPAIWVPWASLMGGDTG